MTDSPVHPASPNDDLGATPAVDPAPALGADAVKRNVSLAVLPVPLERDGFFRSLIRHLAGTLEQVVGLEEAAGFISVVGQHIGEEIDAMYRAALKVPQLSREQVAAVAVDLKRRLGGDFYLIEATPEKIVLGNRVCPFGDKVKGRPSICMMTSNVFGVIAAENLGYAKVHLQETIARGAPECRVTIHLKPTLAAEEADGRVYVKT